MQTLCGYARFDGQVLVHPAFGQLDNPRFAAFGQPVPVPHRLYVVSHVFTVGLLYHVPGGQVLLASVELIHGVDQRALEAGDLVGCWVCDAGVVCAFALTQEEPPSSRTGRRQHQYRRYHRKQNFCSFTHAKRRGRPVEV